MNKPSRTQLAWMRHHWYDELVAVGSPAVGVRA